MEQKKYTPIDKDTKDSIKKVFTQFDADNSGFIDRKEVVAIAKELGQEVSQDEVDKIFSEVDVNKDNKISFSEFTTWWCYGKLNKMEKLVKMKLKAGSMMDRAKFLKNRFAKALSKDPSGKDVQSLSSTIKVGEIEPQTWFDGKLFVGSDAKELFNEIKGDAKANDVFSIIIRVQPTNKGDVNTHLEKIKELNGKVLDFMKEADEELKIFLDEMLQFEYKSDEENVYLIISSDSDYFTDIVEELNGGMEELIDDEFKCSGSLSIGTQNSLKEFYEDHSDSKLVLQFMEGFWVNLEAKTNKTLINNLRNLVIDELKETVDFMSLGFGDVVPLLLTLFNGGKFELSFDKLEKEKAQAFIKDIGSNEALEETPSFKELAEVFREDFDLFSLFTESPQIKVLLDYLADNCKPTVSIYAKLDRYLGIAEFRTQAVGGLWEFLCQDPWAE